MIRQPDDPGVDELARAMRQQETGALFWFCVSILAIGIVLLAWFVPVTVARAQEAGDFPNCRGFIPHSCCCTSGWCRTIKLNEVERRATGWFVVATGQPIKEVKYSEDGDVILCDGNGRAAYCLLLPGPNT